MTTATNFKKNAIRTTPRRIREEGSTAAVTHYVDTRWPAIGGDELAPLPEYTFMGSDFSAAYQPGHVAYVYVAGSGDTLKAPDHPTGLHGLARRFALPLFKISATASENALARIQDINLERYAGMHEARAGLACDPGYDNWRLVLIHPGRKPMQGAPIEARPRVIRVVLPKRLSLIAFEKELHERLRPAALQPWIRSPVGRRHCDYLGLDPREAMRLTGYNTGEGERVSRADELYIFKPRLQGGRLLSIVEHIIHDFVVRDEADDCPLWGWVAVNQGYRHRVR